MLEASAAPDPSRSPSAQAHHPLFSILLSLVSQHPHQFDLNEKPATCSVAQFDEPRCPVRAGKTMASFREALVNDL
jgi:hypothetical protein